MYQLYDAFIDGVLKSDHCFSSLLSAQIFTRSLSPSGTMDALKVVYRSLDTIRAFRNDFVTEEAEVLEITDPTRTHSIMMVKDRDSFARALGVINKNIESTSKNVRSVDESVRPISETIHGRDTVSFDAPSPRTFRDFLTPPPCLSTDTGSKGTARRKSSGASLDFSVRDLRDDTDERNEDEAEDSNDEGEARTEDASAPIGIAIMEATDSDYDDEPKKKKRRTTEPINISRQQRKIPLQSRKQQQELWGLARQERVRRQESDWYWLDTALSQNPSSTIKYTSQAVQDLMLDLPRAMMETPDTRKFKLLLSSLKTHEISTQTDNVYPGLFDEDCQFQNERAATDQSVSTRTADLRDIPDILRPRLNAFVYYWNVAVRPHPNDLLNNICDRVHLANLYDSYHEVTDTLSRSSGMKQKLFEASHGYRLRPDERAKDNHGAEWNNFSGRIAAGVPYAKARSALGVGFLALIPDGKCVFFTKTLKEDHREVFSELVRRFHPDVIEQGKKTARTLKQALSKEGTNCEISKSQSAPVQGKKQQKKRTR